MVRILSVLPMLVGLLCATMLVISIFGYSPPESGTEVPIVPCTDSDIGCNVGMTRLLLDHSMTLQSKQYTVHSSQTKVHSLRFRVQSTE